MIEGERYLQTSFDDECVDLGVAMPEDEKHIEALRQAVVHCARQLNAPDNLAGFRSTVRAMFKAFGVSESERRGDRYKHNNDWNHYYMEWQQMNGKHLQFGSSLADIEMNTTNVGYVNVQLMSTNNPKGANRPVQVFPGPCSFPYSYNLIDRPYPVNFFFDVFERTIGASPIVKRYQWLEGLMFFVVEGNGYKRVTATDKQK